MMTFAQSAGPRVLLIVAVLSLSLNAAAQGTGSASSTSALDHRVLATTKTSTMEKELNEAAEAGFRFQAVMGGDSAFGGKEVIVVMSRAGTERGRYGYKLLATSKTSTMQKELQDAGAQGYTLLGFNAGKTAGGYEVIAILRKDR